MKRSPVTSLPSELLYIGYCWETARELYFSRLGNWSKASDVRELRKIYAHRLWNECGLTIDLEEGF